MRFLAPNDAQQARPAASHSPDWTAAQLITNRRHPKAAAANFGRHTKRNYEFNWSCLGLVKGIGISVFTAQILRVYESASRTVPAALQAN
jgi:hypothetical protein